MLRETNVTSLAAFPRRPRNAGERAPHVLVAEDDNDMRALLGQALRTAGYLVSELSDGLRLIARLAAARPWEYDAIVSDIRMPGASGLEILDGLNAREGAPPMILITAFGDRETHELARRRGVAAMFDKPFEMEDLLAAVRRIAPLSQTS